MILFFLACQPDDYVPGGDDTGVPVANDSLEGSWRSEGEDVSELLAGAPFHYARIDVDFLSAGTYTVLVTDADGQSGTFTGAWTADSSTQPGTIVLDQATPSAAVAEGIWAIEADVLTYEVVQTQPDYGFVPPTPETGFGSTSGEGIDPGVNVQVYRRR